LKNPSVWLHANSAAALSQRAGSRDRFDLDGGGMLREVAAETSIAGMSR
jgi:hypothetical protein